MYIEKHKRFAQDSENVTLKNCCTKNDTMQLYVSTD